MQFIPGQRWISDSESDQGLGTVIGTENRFVDILFTATGSTRKYAIKDAPLTRVVFNVGDSIPSHEGFKVTVEQVLESNGTFTYVGPRSDTGEIEQLKEVMIDHFIKFNKPHDRLLNGQVDRLDWYRLRRDCLKHQFEQQQSELSGLVGARVSLIPHQLYIADEVGKRFAPRVLLADEVGLGKTIEAGLIIHQQLVSGRAGRVLVVVPEALTNQWLVEMMRRFNLKFSIFDDERCLTADAENPFSSEQLVLVNLDFVTDNPQWFDALCEEDWDLMVVDEAHHLSWQPDDVSVEYQCIETLAQKIPGVLLLTATPDQLGHEGHFARLRLLDSNRFYDYAKFVEEESHYADIADAANSLLSTDDLTTNQTSVLENLLQGSDDKTLIGQVNTSDDQRDTARHELVNQLLDRHGTGRILFRNSRNTIKGFPQRHLIATGLDLPEAYAVKLEQLVANANTDEKPSERMVKQMFTPEVLFALDNNHQGWTEIDPRVDFLIELLLSKRQEKILVICAHAQTAIDLEQALRVREGIRAAIFHEGMSIFERDRAAAYFAQEEDSAQVLLCSEIGSEGRNFQFAHHLVLFDLPLNPDLLEQRIGRLDRIGQTDTIKIHVPYFNESPSEILFNWYHQALNAFEHTCITGRNVYEAYGQQLIDLCLQGQWQASHAKTLITDSEQLHLELKANLESGRDKLLEIRSSGQGKAQQLVQQIESLDNDIHLPQFMFQVFDVFGIAQDDISDSALALQPTEHMLSPTFPNLPEDGTSITFNRELALACEDYQLITWDHPMVTGAMDLVLSDEIGNSSIGLLKNPALPAGTFFVECLFTLEATAPAQLQLNRFLPTTPIRILVDKNGNDLADKVSESVLDKQLTPVKKQVALQLVKALKTAVPPLVDAALTIAEAQIAEITNNALAQLEQNLTAEHQRLTALAAINPSVRQEEIDFIDTQKTLLSKLINKAQLKFEAVRLVVVSQ